MLSPLKVVVVDIGMIGLFAPDILEDATYVDRLYAYVMCTGLLLVRSWLLVLLALGYDCCYRFVCVWYVYRFVICIIIIISIITTIIIIIIIVVIGLFAPWSPGRAADRGSSGPTRTTPPEHIGS